MNSSCFADIFRRWGKRYLRCFLDSTLVEIKSIPDECPHCHRPLDPVICKNPTQYDEVLIQIDLPHYKKLARAGRNKKSK